MAELNIPQPSWRLGALLQASVHDTSGHIAAIIPVKHGNKQVLPSVPEVYPLSHANFNPLPYRTWLGPAKHEEFPLLSP